MYNAPSVAPLIDIFTQARAAKERREQVDWQRKQAERQDKLESRRLGILAGEKQQEAEFSKARRAAIQKAYQTGDLSEIMQIDPDTGMKIEAGLASRNKAQVDAGADQARQLAEAQKREQEEAQRRAAAEFNLTRQLRQNPSAAGAIDEEAARAGVQLPVTRVEIAGEDKPIDIPPDVAAARARAEAAGAEIKGPSAVDLRGKLEGSQLLKATEEVEIAKSKVLGAPAGPVGDMSLIYGVMKLQDPASSVKEGEYDQAKDAQGAYGRLGGLWKRLVEGDTLNDTQRKQFKAEAARLYEVQRAKLEPKLDYYRELARSEGFSPDQVVQPTREAPQPQRPAAAPQQAPGPQQKTPPMPPQRIDNVRKAYDALVAKGATPEQALQQLVRAKAITPQQAQDLLPRLAGGAQ